MGKDASQSTPCAIRIGVVRLPFISNYTDFDPFERDPGIDLVYFDRPAQIFGFDAVLIPGSKNTIEDLAATRRAEEGCPAALLLPFPLRVGLAERR